MKTKPFHHNHWGIYTLYNGANKVYAHELIKETQRKVQVMGKHGMETVTVQLPVARVPTSDLAGKWESPRAKIDSLAAEDKVLHKKLHIVKDAA